ncbi:hypothetical protein K1W54_39135 [Micromonospora sp. CPCC 205371]|nr:hypothetical protein [Micromonospora sp. CPCC 205371]
MSLRRIVPMPRRAPADVPSVLGALAAAVRGHSPLRPPPPAAAGGPRQGGAPAGQLPVHIVEGDDAADAVADALTSTPFDHEREWPQRFALVLSGGRVRHVVCVFSHTTVDFRAAEMVLRDLRLLVLRGAITSPPDPQSVDVARREQGIDRQRSPRAVAYWVKGFGRLPPDTLPLLEAPAKPRFQRMVLVSEAADTAVRMAATRSRVTTSTVLLAATAAVFSRWSGTDICGIHTMVSNRALPEYGAAIAKLNQVGLVIVDTSDRPGFAALLPRVWRAALEAYRHAHYDPDELARAFEAAGYPYESGVSPHCFLNDIRLVTDADLFGRDTGEEAVRAALARTTCELAEGFERFTWRMRVQFLDAPRAIGIAVTGDTAYLPPPAAERFLRDIERLVVDAAFRDLPWPWLPNPSKGVAS